MKQQIPLRFAPPPLAKWVVPHFAKGGLGGIFILVILLLAACGSGLNDGSNNGSTVTMPATTGLLNSILISPAASSVTACTPSQFTATGYYSDGTSQDVTSGVFWQIDSSSSAVAIADSAKGLIVGTSPGSAIVSAWAGNIVASSAVLTVSVGSVNGIVITPASSTIAAKSSQSYVATASCSVNGVSSTLDITAYNIWSSSDTGIATINSYGLATAVAAGSADIIATAGTVAASSVLNVQ